MGGGKQTLTYKRLFEKSKGRLLSLNVIFFNNYKKSYVAEDVFVL